MGAASCEDEELEFKLVFGEEKEAPPLGAGGLGEELDSEDAPPCCRLALGEPPPYGAAPIGIPRPPPPRPGMHSPPPRPAPSPGTWESQPARSVRLGGPGGGAGGAGGGRVLECPSIRITSISPTPEPPAALEDNPDTWGDGSPRDYPPPEGFGGYREAGGQGGGAFFSPSPGSSSLSSWSFFSDASDEAALYAACDEVESELNEAASRFGLGSPLPSPRASPRPWTPEDPWSLYGPSPGGRGPEDNWLLLSAPGPTPASPRPASPCGKRRYSSSGTPSSASPALSRRGSLGEEGSEPPPPPPLPLARDPGSPGPFDYVGAPPAESIPQKTRRTSSEQAVALPRSEEPAPCNGKLPLGAEESVAPPGGPRKEVAGMDYLATGPPPSYRPGLRMFPETRGTTGCAQPPPVSFLPRPFPSDPYGGRGSSFPLGLPFSPPAPFRPPLPASPPLEVPFPSQSDVHPLPAEGYNKVGPGYGPGEGAPEQEKSRGGYSSGFRDSVPIQGITLEEGGCGTGGCEYECVQEIAVHVC
uniref:Nuclear factor of activated T cells 4 n=1 Tax=Macaca nemestrina TaxID=9545 RepID=A0A2K6BL60_MACNE